jgi:hypothetical protein
MSIRVGAVVVVVEERLVVVKGLEGKAAQAEIRQRSSPAARLFSHLIVPRVRVLPPLPSSIFGQMPCITALLQHPVDRG